jgi:hypothetical protein
MPQATGTLRKRPYLKAAMQIHWNSLRGVVRIVQGLFLSTAT